MSIPSVQTGGNNISIPWLQGIDISSIGPNLELMAIPYSENQPIDPNLWDSKFSPISLFGVKKFLDKDAQNIACLLIRIEIFI